MPVVILCWAASNHGTATIHAVIATTKAMIQELKLLLETIRSDADTEARAAAGKAEVGLQRLHKLKKQAMAINSLTRPKPAPKARGGSAKANIIDITSG